MDMNILRIKKNYANLKQKMVGRYSDTICGMTKTMRMRIGKSPGKWYPPTVASFFYFVIAITISLQNSNKSMRKKT